jgi:hypothetical protein
MAILKFNMGSYDDAIEWYKKSLSIKISLVGESN